MHWFVVCFGVAIFSLLSLIVWSSFLVKVMFEWCSGVGFSCMFFGLLFLGIFYPSAYVLNNRSSLMNEFQFGKKKTRELI